MGRKIMAKIYDLIIFVVLVCGTYMPADGYIYSMNLPKYSYALLVLGELILFFLLFALIPGKTQATIGQSLEKLVMKPTSGHITVFRLFVKGIISFIAYLPIMIIIIMTLIRNSMSTTGGQVFPEVNLYLILAILLVVVDLVLNLYLFNKFDQSVSDRVCDVKVTLKKRKTINFKDFKDLTNGKDKYSEKKEEE